jgi:hypothetical protein
MSKHCSRVAVSRPGLAQTIPVVVVGRAGQVVMAAPEEDLVRAPISDEVVEARLPELPGTMRATMSLKREPKRLCEPRGNRRPAPGYVGH